MTMNRNRQRAGFLPIKQQKIRENSSAYSSFFFSTLIVIAAITTFAFGFISSISRENYDYLTEPERVWAAIQAFSAGFLVMILLDGSRLGWEAAMRRSGNSRVQFAIATILMVCFAVGSIYASWQSLPVLGQWLGIPMEYNAFEIKQAMTFLLKTSVVGNLAGVFLYLALSPDSRMILSASAAEAQQQETMISAYAKAHKNASN